MYTQAKAGAEFASRPVKRRFSGMGNCSVNGRRPFVVLKRGDPRTNRVLQVFPVG